MCLARLLLYLREMVLQDSVTLRKRFHNSSVWAHAVFQPKVHEPFTDRMRTVVGDDKEWPSQLAVFTQA
jgi:hypothetical protein